jgi:hypothetical protein
MLDRETVAFVDAEIAEAAEAENAADLLGHQYRVALRHTRLPPSAAVLEIGRRLVPDRGVVQDRMIVNRENARQIGFGRRPDHASAPAHADRLPGAAQY